MATYALNKTRKDGTPYIAIRVVRYNPCVFKYCFRPGHTTIFLPDAAGMSTPVMTYCRHHSGTNETEVYVNCREEF
jgi:hypothetical protein